jgi:hypothetical protein
MRVYETTTHVGSDGRLRLDMPVQEKGQDVQVAVVVEPKASDSLSAGDSLQADRSKLEAAGVSIPALGAWSRRKTPRLVVAGLPVSQTLLEDRR